MQDTGIKNLTQDDLNLVAETFNRKYRGSLMGTTYDKARFFQVSAHKDQQGVYAKITLQNHDQSFFYPVEGQMADMDHDLDPKDAVLFLLDSMDSYWEEYLKNPDVFLPIDWAEYESDGIPFQLKGQIFNLQLERLADRLLGEESSLSI